MARTERENLLEAAHAELAGKLMLWYTKRGLTEAELAMLLARELQALTVNAVNEERRRG